MALSTLALGAALDPGGLLAWLIVGLIAGFLASTMMRGGGYGMVGDIIIGVVGAFIGGFLVNLLDPGANFGFWGSIVVAFIGACVLIALLRAFSQGKEESKLWQIRNNLTSFNRELRRVGIGGDSFTLTAFSTSMKLM